MKVIIQKIDLDTCLTAYLLGVKDTDEVIYINGDAPSNHLQDSNVICIEAGGSGFTALNNFDHHNTRYYLPPASKQAYDYAGNFKKSLYRLVEYVGMVDEFPWKHPKTGFPSLANVFSGMLLAILDPRKQLFGGLEIIHYVIQHNIDPFSSMPDILEWRPYRQRKYENAIALNNDLKKSKYFLTNIGLYAGFIESEAIGGNRFLFLNGCSIALLFNPRFGMEKVKKYTVAGNNICVLSLVPVFSKKENGWGGKYSIIGSPRCGSSLTTDEVIKVIKEYT